MEWYYALLFIFFGMMFLIALGLPVAFALLLVVFMGSLYFLGPQGPHMFIISMFGRLANFTLAPIPLFVFMGAIMLHSGLATIAIHGAAKWLGKIPGRLSILAVVAGTIFGVLSGSTIASTAMLGTILVPDMMSHGYSKSMSMGPILASGGLAMLIPPSALAVIYATVAEVSIGKLLMAGLFPGLLMAFMYLMQIILRVKLNPSLAPIYDVDMPGWKERIKSFVTEMLPLGLIIFVVLGLIILGIATPTESAGLGAASTLLLTIFYGKFNFTMLKKALKDTTSVSVMALFIIASSVAYSQILTCSGASTGVVNLISDLAWNPYAILVLLMLIVTFLGMIMDQTPIIMITVPVFAPIVSALGFEPIWFGVIILVTLQIALTTPPFGMLIFVMKGVAPKDTTITDLYKSALPFILCDIISVSLIIIFPMIALWLPSVM